MTSQIHINSNTFAEACYDMNTIEELEEALHEEADQGDMDAWNLTPEAWREEIELALAALRADR